MTTPDIQQGPYVHYARMRASTPIFFNSDRKVWEVYGYHDIQTVLGDPSSFSSTISTQQTMVVKDPPRHTQLRKLVARAFTTKMIADLEPSIRTITGELLDRVAQGGRMDIISDFAFPLPITVIAELLGLPAEDREKFKAWSVSAIKNAEMELQGMVPEPHLVAAVGELTAYLKELVIERQCDPRSDLISALATGSVDGEQLTLEEICATCGLLLIAGFETTTNLIGNAMHLLLKHPDSLARLKAEPELVPSAIEESLRYWMPFQFFARIATRDVDLRGHAISKGQQLMVFSASGNRDEAVFPDADRFDITREPNRHLSFGHGIHYCLGAGLGRLEAKIGIGELLRRFPDLRLDDDNPPVPLASKVLFGSRSLPIRFTPVS